MTAVQEVRTNQTSGKIRRYMKRIESLERLIVNL